MSVKQQVKSYIEEFITYGDPIDDDTSLLESGMVDSTGAMEMVLFLEETFDITINDKDVDPENLDTVNLITTFVESKQKEAA